MSSRRQNVCEIEATLASPLGRDRWFSLIGPGLDSCPPPARVGRGVQREPDIHLRSRSSAQVPRPEPANPHGWRPKIELGCKPPASKQSTKGASEHGHCGPALLAQSPKREDRQPRLLEAAAIVKDRGGEYGADSRQYKDAQRSIDAYGRAGVDNGVLIKVGGTGQAGAQVQVAGVAGTKAASNPTGQQIDVTFNTGQLGKSAAHISGLSAHEGSHVADASDWVASRFKDALNPARYATEFRAYQVQASIGDGAGFLYTTLGTPPQYFTFRGWPQSNIDARINYFLGIPQAQGGLYGLTPSSRRKAFVPGSRLGR